MSCSILCLKSGSKGVDADVALTGVLVRAVVDVVFELRLVRVSIFLLLFLEAAFLPFSAPASSLALSRFFSITATINKIKQGISTYNIFLPLH